MVVRDANQLVAGFLRRLLVVVLFGDVQDLLLRSNLLVLDHVPDAVGGQDEHLSVSELVFGDFWEL